MARNHFAIDKPRKLSITIGGYAATDLARAHVRKFGERQQRIQQRQQQQEHAQRETEQRCRYEAACAEMQEFEQLNEALSISGVKR